MFCRSYFVQNEEEIMKLSRIKSLPMISLLAFFTALLLALLQLSFTPIALLANTSQSNGVLILDVILAATPNPVQVGQPLTFTVNITNTSGITLDNFSIVDHLPVELESASVSYRIRGGEGISTTVWQWRIHTHRPKSGNGRCVDIDNSRNSSKRGAGWHSDHKCAVHQRNPTVHTCQQKRNHFGYCGKFKCRSRLINS